MIFLFWWVTRLLFKNEHSVYNSLLSHAKISYVISNILQTDRGLKRCFATIENNFESLNFFYLGKTSLIIGYYWQPNMDLHKILLEHGADVNAKDIKGKVWYNIHLWMYPTSYLFIHRYIDWLQRILSCFSFT